MTTSTDRIREALKKGRDAMEFPEDSIVFTFALNELVWIDEDLAELARLREER